LQLGLFVVFQNSYTITDDEIMCLFECCILCHGTTCLLLVLADIQIDSGTNEMSNIFDHPPTLQ